MAIPLFEMKLSKAPIIILKGGDRQLTFYKANKFASKYFAIKDTNGGGMVFELDDRYEYRYRSTSVYIYNFSNFKPISLTGLAEIDKKLRSDGKSQLDNIDIMLSQLTDEQVRNFADKIKDPKAGFSPETRRFLEDYSTDDENAKTEMMVSVHHQKNPITRYSAPLIGMGINTGNYAIIQIGHKKLDIVPMHLHDNRAYTEYGVFNFTVDNLYLVKKQVVAFFILNDTEDSISQPVPKPVSRTIKRMARKKQWSLLETFNKPKRTKMSNQKIAYRVKVERIETQEDEEAKARVNAALKPKPIPTTQKKVKKVDEDEDFNEREIEHTAIQDAHNDFDILDAEIPEFEPQQEEPELIEEEPDLQVKNDIISEPIIEESIEDEDDGIDLNLVDATGPPSDR